MTEEIIIPDGILHKKAFQDALPHIRQYFEGFTAEQLLALKKDLSKLGAKIEKVDIEEAIQKVLDDSANTLTFAIPSHSLMFSLLALFAGKPEQIPRKLLEKPYNERTPQEQEEAESYLKNIFEAKEEADYSEGVEKITEKKIALICNNQRVEGKAEISWSLFRHDIHFREERLAMYIKRTFGPEGIRHLLALIIGLEENFRKGHFTWSVNEHLERLGYRRKSHGSFDMDLKRTASEIIKIFTGLCITSVKKDGKDGKNGSITGKFLFMVEGFELETFEKEIIDEKITLVATDFWYRNAFSMPDQQTPQYTKLLKEIVRENHREHPLTLYLTPLLAIFWRISPQRKMKVKNLMEWCDLDVTDKHRSYHLKDLESTLEYMKQKGYLGDWFNDGEHRLPSSCKHPFECTLTLLPPEWLKQEFQKIEHKREAPALTEKQENVSKEELIQIIDQTGLTNKQFANCIGVTPQLISAILNNTRPITRETSDKIRQFMKAQNQQK